MSADLEQIINKAMNVRWKEINYMESGVRVRYSDYEVSDTGLVYSKKRGRYLKHKIARGYHSVHLYAYGSSKHLKVHRMVCNLFNGQSLPGKPEVDHIDQDRGNNEHTNLRWVSRTENNRNRRGSRLNRRSPENDEGGT